MSLPNQIREDLYDSNLRASLEGLDFSRLDDLAASKLEELFTEEEVHAALLNLKGDKARGLMASLPPFGIVVGILLRWTLWISSRIFMRGANFGKV